MPYTFAQTVTENVALRNPTLYISMVFAVVLLGIVIKYISGRDKRDDERTANFTKTLTEVAHSSAVATKEQAEACHALQREMMGRCEDMANESNATIRECTKHLALHSEAVRDCDRCGNYKPKLGGAG